MYGSIFWLMVKLGMAAALAGGGYLLNATGFDVALGGAQKSGTITLLRIFDAGIPIVDVGHRHLGRGDLPHHGSQSPRGSPGTGAPQGPAGYVAADPTVQVRLRRRTRV